MYKKVTFFAFMVLVLGLAAGIMPPIVSVLNMRLTL